ncbi:MAG: Uncharacterised protein [SAR116 cluster bacterium]|nr:MAG: Uncharacterised protein [SAR116 cluster bacterium]
MGAQVSQGATGCQIKGCSAAIITARALISEIRRQAKNLSGAGDKQIVAPGINGDIRIPRLCTKGQRTENTAGHTRLGNKINLARCQARPHWKSCGNAEYGLTRCLQRRGIIAGTVPLYHAHRLGDGNAVSHIAGEIKFCHGARRLAADHRHDADLAIFKANAVDLSLGQDDFRLVLGDGHPPVDRVQRRHPATKLHLDILDGDGPAHLGHFQAPVTALAGKRQTHIFHPA